MKYRLIELKDKEGTLCYRIQKRNFLHIWKNVRTTKIEKELLNFIKVNKSIRDFYSKEYALKIIDRLKTKYPKYRDCRIYPTISDNIFYTLGWSNYRYYNDGEIYNYLIYGSYQECCDKIDKCIESSNYKQIINL